MKGAEPPRLPPVRVIGVEGTAVVVGGGAVLDGGKAFTADWSVEAVGGEVDALVAVWAETVGGGAISERGGTLAPSDWPVEAVATGCPEGGIAKICSGSIIRSSFNNIPAKRLNR